jgi:hypothetical protein
MSSFRCIFANSFYAFYNQISALDRKQTGIMENAIATFTQNVSRVILNIL